jgi:hypothetical protein
MIRGRTSALITVTQGDFVYGDRAWFLGDESVQGIATLSLGGSLAGIG